MRTKEKELNPEVSEWNADDADASNADDRGSEKNQRKSAPENPLCSRSIKKRNADIADAKQRG